MIKTMKTKNLILLAVILVSSIALTFTSCKKEVVNTITQKESNADKNSTFAQQTFEEEQGVIDGEIMSPPGSKSTASGSGIGSECLTVTFDLTSSPMKATLDFGTSNCLCADGKNRRGKINVTFKYPFTDSLNFVSSTFENYFVNDNQIVGTRVVTNKGHNSSGHLNFDVSTNGSIIMANNGGTITYVSNHNREWTAGESTPLDISDDSYSFTGSSSGTTVTNQAFTLNITTPLVFNVACNRFVSGVFELTPEGEVVRSLDFGNGDCDALATVTVLGFSFQITLP
jgi:hypothetical protein